MHLHCITFDYFSDGVSLNIHDKRINNNYGKAEKTFNMTSYAMT